MCEAVLRASIPGRMRRMVGRNSLHVKISPKRKSCNQHLPGRCKSDVLRPGIVVGMRGPMVLRAAPMLYIITPRPDSVPVMMISRMCGLITITTDPPATTFPSNNYAFFLCDEWLLLRGLLDIRWCPQRAQMSCTWKAWDKLTLLWF